MKRIDVDTLVGLTYETALDPGRWPDLVGSITEAVEADRGLVFVADWSNRDVSTLVRHEISPELHDSWAVDYIEYDVWSHALAPRDAGFVATGASVVDRAVWHRSPLYGDVCIPAKIDDLLSTSLAKENGVHSVLSFFSNRLFERRHVELLEHLSPHLRRVVVLQRQLSGLRARAEAGEAGLDRLTVAVFTLDARGQVVRANAKGEALLRANDGLGIRARRLVPARPQERAQLDAAIGRAASAAIGRVAGGGSALALARPSLRRPLGVVVVPVVSRGELAAPVIGEDVRRRAAVLVTVSDPEDVQTPPVVRLAQIFGFTEAEARIAAALAGRRSLEACAEQLQISLNTARTHLKSIFAKTGCRRQAELVQMLATSVAGLMRE